MLKQSLLILFILTIIYLLDTSQSMTLAKVAAGAATVSAMLCWYQSIQNKKERKAIFRKIRELTALLKDKNGRFMEKCLSSSPELIRNIEMYSNYTLLIASVCFQGYEEAKFLIEKMKIDVNEKARNGETALIRAVQVNDSKMVQLLLNAGASIELRTKQEISALIVAITHNRPILVDLLLKYGACINTKTINKGVQSMIDNCSEEIKTVISFHKAWRRKKNMLKILDAQSQKKEESGLSEKDDLIKDPLETLNRKADLFKSIIRDFM
ncbi:unnamed protein product [Moneuplotes crassus]|uniref:Uncharacterized protein n=1 Tax=Euplotes crassus TaxID=5936 RepID=A0AAD1XND1_EUPCR|nr:unnamed protein product [Moneuplotes crassus]